MIDLMRNELFVLQKTDSPHITRTFELLEDNKSFFVVMELLDGGDLFHYLKQTNDYTEVHAARIIYQLLLGLNYMHSMNITHRDLKPENMMCVKGKTEDDMMIKLTDFGFSCLFDPECKMDLCLGTPQYMAPELANFESYDEHVDVWSTGIITYQCLCGDVPFNTTDMSELKEMLIN